MNAPAALAPNQPSHVPDALVFDFDIYGDPRIGEDVQGTYALALEQAPDIFWTRLNGGHWIVKGFDAITAVVTDPEHFSVREMQIPRVENPPFFIPLSLDPPENLPYRRAMMPMFGPTAIKALEPSIRQWAERFVGAVADKGRCDFQVDVSKLFPVSVFMELMGMDLSRLQDFRHLAEAFFENQNNEAELGRLSALIIGTMKAV
ncbi:MAG: cytochrome P450, partial [Sphingobium sp.]